MADYLTNTTDLTAVADAIRSKGGTSAALEWPQGYVDAIGAISGGGGGTEKTITVTLTNPINASEAMNPACTIHEAEDPMNPGAQIGQIETPTGSTTVTTSASCIVAKFHSYGMVANGSPRIEQYGLFPINSSWSIEGGSGFYVSGSGSATIDGVDYDD